MPPVATRDDPALRHANILDQAIRVIGERGYYGFTVQELAQSCGLSNAGLLHHFASKERLFLAALQEMQARETLIMTPLVHAAEQPLGDDRARQAVRKVLRAMVTRSTAQPQLLRFFAAMNVEALNPLHPAHDWWMTRECLVTELFARLLAPHVKGPEPVARQLLAMMDGFCLRWLWADQAFDPAAEWDRMLARLLPELTTQSARERRPNNR